MIQFTKAKSSNYKLRVVYIINLIFIFYLFILGFLQIVSAEDVNIPDSTLRDLIEATLEKDAGEIVTQEDMENLEVLKASRCNYFRSTHEWVCGRPDMLAGPTIHNLTGLEYAVKFERTTS